MLHLLLIKMSFIINYLISYYCQWTSILNEYASFVRALCIPVIYIYAIIISHAMIAFLHASCLITEVTRDLNSGLWIWCCPLRYGLYMTSHLISFSLACWHWVDHTTMIWVIIKCDSVPHRSPLRWSVSLWFRPLVVAMRRASLSVRLESSSTISALPSESFVRLWPDRCLLACRLVLRHPSSNLPCYSRLSLNGYSCQLLASYSCVSTDTSWRSSINSSALRR